ncbi:hypothetical protein AYL99_10347 [Fonsecaea erecta]|uniref:Uncharacterized protein n=1 Tax=Fonsecaea erecta TaxID=1367422 RepID=A0A178Z6H5_9EURO|nr:hypothetical protein AYL99_10347 [Fonsecaea erecta]OAP55374.1 hypothetical protein AYL99_10347 [Fonsecaea erecta]
MCVLTPGLCDRLQRASLGPAPTLAEDQEVLTYMVPELTMPPRSNTYESLRKSSSSPETNNSNNISRAAGSVVVVGEGKQAMVQVEGEEAIVDEVVVVVREEEVDEGTGTGTVAGEVEEAEGKVEVN